MDKASITVTTQAAEKVYRAIHESAQIYDDTESL